MSYSRERSLGWSQGCRMFRPLSPVPITLDIAPWVPTSGNCRRRRSRSGSFNRLSHRNRLVSIGKTVQLIRELPRFTPLPNPASSLTHAVRGWSCRRMMLVSRSLSGRELTRVVVITIGGLEFPTHSLLFVDELHTADGPKGSSAPWARHNRCHLSVVQTLSADGFPAKCHPSTFCCRAVGACCRPPVWPD